MVKRVGCVNAKKKPHPLSLSLLRRGKLMPFSFARRRVGMR